MKHPLKQAAVLCSAFALIVLGSAQVYKNAPLRGQMDFYFPSHNMLSPEDMHQYDDTAYPDGSLPEEDMNDYVNLDSDYPTYDGSEDNYVNPDSDYPMYDESTDVPAYPDGVMPEEDMHQYDMNDPTMAPAYPDGVMPEEDMHQYDMNDPTMAPVYPDGVMPEEDMHQYDDTAYPDGSMPEEDMNNYVNPDSDYPTYDGSEDNYVNPDSDYPMYDESMDAMPEEDMHQYDDTAYPDGSMPEEDMNDYVNPNGESSSSDHYAAPESGESASSAGIEDFALPENTIVAPDTDAAGMQHDTTNLNLDDYQMMDETPPASDEGATVTVTQSLLDAIRNFMKQLYGGDQ